MSINSGIYRISSVLKPHKFYIGSTTDLKQRKTVHFYRLKNNRHHSKMMQAHYNKYGNDDLVFEVIREVENKTLLLSIEQSYIDSLKPFFNSSPVAASNLGIKLGPQSIEHREKISKANKGRIVSEYSRALRRKPLYKYNLNGELLKTYPSLTEARILEQKNISISTDRTPTFDGFIWVNDLNKLPDFSAIRQRLLIGNKKDCKAVIQVGKNGNVISEFESAREAWRKTGAHPSKICMAASGKRVTAGGFKWQYKAA